MNIRHRSFSASHINDLRRERHRLGHANVTLQPRSYAGSRRLSENFLDSEYTSEPCVSSSLSSSLRRESRRRAKRDKKLKLRKEYEEAKLATKIRRRRRWSADEAKSRSGRLMRNIAEAWQSLFDDKTYIVVNQQGTTFRFSESKSLFLFDRDSQIRQFCINLFIRPLFSHFIMLVILANCVCMMLAEPPEWIDTHLEYVFTGIYCFEAVVKIIARGFVLHRFSYLRDPWNWLDFIVIFFAILTEILKAALASDELGQLSVLRAFRVLRALKTMSVVPGLRGIVKALLRSIRALKDAVALTIFCVSVFALIGYQLFHGTLRNKCVLIAGNVQTGPDGIFLTDWNEEYYANIYTSNDNWTFSNSYLQNSSSLPQDIHLPYFPSPIYDTDCGNISQCHKVFYPLLNGSFWSSGDAILMTKLFQILNSTQNISSISYGIQHANTTTTCSDLLQECTVSFSFENQTANSSLLNFTANITDKDWVFQCDEPESLSNVTSSPTSYYATPGYSNNSFDIPAMKNCTYSGIVMASNISCLYDKLGIDRYNENLTSHIRNHDCYEKSDWIKTLYFGANTAVRWNTRKNIVFFQLGPPGEELTINTTNLGEVFDGNSFLMFEEYSRSEMDEKLRNEWDCDDKNYVMRDVDAGMYFYMMSSNRPGPEPRYCKIGKEGVCPISHECRKAGGNPDFGYTNFDDFFWAFLSSFRLINQDAWSRLFYLTLHTIGETYVIFYIIVMFLGSYYLINLILAVVYMAYEEQQAVAEEEALEEEEHKAEKRELEGSSDDEPMRSTKDEDNGSHRSSVRSCCAEEGRPFGLITTSLTSIADSSATRRSRRSSRRNRYGHRRPPVKVDPESEQLYRKYTKRYGDGMSHDYIDQAASEERRKRRDKFARARHDSLASTGSFATVSEQNSCSRCSSQNESGLNNSFTNYCPNCRNRRPLQRSSSPSRDRAIEAMEKEKIISNPDPNIKVIITQETPLVSPNDEFSHPFLAPGRTPEPVGARLKKSNLDVLAVDFTPGRSLSIYSTGSDLENDEHNQHTSEVFSLKQIPGCETGDVSRGVSLAVPFDRASQSTFSVSSNSELIDGGEQVVQAEVTGTHSLAPPTYAESISGSTISPTDLSVSPDPRQPGTNLTVPSLMVTSASSEHILDIGDSSSAGTESRNGYSVHSKLPAIAGSPSLSPPDGITNACDDAVKSEDGNSSKRSISSRNRRHRRKSAHRQYSAESDDIRRNGRDAILAVSAINSVHPAHRFDDAYHRFRFLDKDPESYEMPLLNGYQDNADLTAIAANMVLSDDDPTHESRSLKKTMERYVRRGKRGFVRIFCKWSCCTPQWERFQKGIRLIVLDPFMDLFITLCIFLNTIFMMMEYHPADATHKNTLEVANLVFTTIFTSEMLLKVIGLSPYTYFRETWNVFDAVVVISSLLEIVLQTIPGLSVLRAFRLMRILKLAKSWPTLNKLLRIIGRTLGKLWHLTLVFLLVLFIFAVVGMQLLKDKYNEEFEVHMPRWNFVDFPHAFMVVFRIQCGEWIENMFTCMNVAPAGICIPLFILVLVIGNLVILNLFLALLLNSFSGDALQRTDAERNSLAEAWQRILHWIHAGTRALARRDVLANCCSKLRLQLCLGKRSTGKRPGVNKENPMKTSYIENPKTETTVLRDTELESGNMENNNHNEVVASIEKPNHNSGDHAVLNHARNRYFEKDEEIVYHSNHDDARKPGSLHHSNHCHSCRHNRHINNRGEGDKGESSKVKSESLKMKSEGEDGKNKNMVTCQGCHKEFPAPVLSHKHFRRKPKMREGFAPAAHFQNRPDEEPAPSNRPDEEITLHPRRALQTHDSIEHAKHDNKSDYKHHSKSSNNVTHPEHSPRERVNSNASRKSKLTTGSVKSGKSYHRQNSKSDEECQGDGNKCTVETKCIDVDEADVLVISGNNGKPGPPSVSAASRRNGTIVNSGSTRRRSNVSIPSSRLSVSSVRDRRSLSHSRSVSRTSSQIEEEITEEQAGDKEDAIPQCFPPYWTSKTDGKWWKIRVFFYDIAVHRYFENVVIFCILLSSVALAFEDIHLENNKAMKTVLQVLDKFFCAFFAIEMLIKWVGFGIRYYFTNAWCLLDFVIVFFSLLDLFMTLTGGSSDQLGALRVLRTFRALRPLRALSRFEGMKVVVDALVRAIPSIFHVFLVCVIVWLIFSILGVNFFGGKFGRCVMFRGESGVIMPRRGNETGEVDIPINETCLPNMTFPLSDEYIPAVRDRKECEECARMMDNTTQIKWIVPSVNFDNVGAGFLALMQVATFKGWLEIMASAVDITGEEQQPAYEFSFYNYFYFCIFIVFGAFFSLNLFIGVIIDNFNQQKVKCAGGEDGVFLTDEQKRYYNAMKRMAAKAPSKPIPRPNSWFANKIYNLVTDRKFEMAVMAMILLNMFVMAIEHYDMDPKMQGVLENLNLFFICVFFIEAVLKLIGLRLYYFTVFWNVFDIIVVIVSIIASALSEMIEKYFVQPTLFRIIRLFRVTRILRLIREAKGIRTLLFALMMSLPALFNIGSLLFLVIFIYAILGMSQFAYIQKIAGVDNILNFETFPNTFLVLFQVSTSEGWNTFIEPILRDKYPLCDPTIKTPNGNGNCGNPTVGVAYFVTFVLITFLIVINMYIAIILENFEVATRESSEPLNADDFEQFFEVWQRYDDKLTQFVTIEQLQHFLHHLDYPLRVPFPNRAFIVNAKMKITKTGRVHCLEVIIALIKKVLGDSPELDTFRDAMLQSFMLKCKTKEPVDEEDMIDTVEYERRRRSAIIIQKAYKKWKASSVKDDFSDGGSTTSNSEVG